jgi:hypothetical protein
VIDKARIAEEAKHFFEWPDTAQRDTVTLTSCVIFATVMAEMAWWAARKDQREAIADMCGNMAAVSWAEWDEKADPIDQGKALALEHVAALLEPNVELSGARPSARLDAAATERAGELLARLKESPDER